MTTSDESALGVFVKIYGPLSVGDGEYLSRWNDELYEIYGDIDIAQRIRRQRLRWLGHVDQLNKNTTALKVFDAVSDGGSRGRPSPG